MLNIDNNDKNDIIHKAEMPEVTRKFKDNDVI